MDKPTEEEEMESEDKAVFTVLAIIASIFPLGIIAYGIVAIIEALNGC